MGVREIRQLLDVKPFEPFGIYMSDGSAYPVKHPDQVILTLRAAYVGISGSNGQRLIAQQVVICSLVHITRLGPVPRAARKRPSK